MLKNYLLIAFRNLWKHKLFSGINIFGLALSMSVCLVALANIRDAFTYDTFHPHANRTYRVITDVAARDGGQTRWATSPMPLAAALSRYSFMEKTVRVCGGVYDEVTANNKTVKIGGAFTEPSFFDVFGFTLRYGDPRSALRQPNSVVLTEKAAALFFGSANPLGKLLSFKTLKNSYIVTGVIKDNRQKSHLSNQVYISMNAIPALEQSKAIAPVLNEWSEYTRSATYVLLKETASRDELLSALSAIAATEQKVHPARNLITYQYDLQALSRISPGESLWQGGDFVSLRSLFVMGGITLILLCLACFNYTNLSLARAFSRVKEVGIRKVAGGSRAQLFAQFITEAVVVSILSLAFAIVLFILIVNYQLVPARMIEKMHVDVSLVLLMLGFAVFTGWLAGFLPAWILSSFNPIQVFHKLSELRIFKGLGIQKTLTVIQFTVSLVAVIVLVTINRQTEFAIRFSYGYNTHNLVTLPAGGNKAAELQQELLRQPEVTRMALSSAVFGDFGSWMQVKSYRDKEGTGADTYYADEHFIPLMGLKLVAGSGFTGSSALNLAVVNEFAVKTFGFKNPDAAIGRQLWLDDSTQIVISGVVKNISYMNLKHPIGNMIIVFAPQKCKVITVETIHHDPKLIALLNSLYARLYPGSAPDIQYYDDDLKDRRSYTNDTNVITFLTFMAISIACIGLLGIVTYAARIRQKEIGIRKVMGAGLATIVYILSKDFLRLILIAFVVAAPAGYLLGNSYLRIFTQRIELGWEILCFSGGLVLVLALLTISSQTLRAAMANPVKSLRGN